MLDLIFNKAVKTQISEKYNVWIANAISMQLEKCTELPEVKVSLKLSVIKPMHVKKIENLRYHLRSDKEMIVSGFKIVEISEAIENTQTITEKVENSLKEL